MQGQPRPAVGIRNAWPQARVRSSLIVMGNPGIGRYDHSGWLLETAARPRLQSGCDDGSDEACNPEWLRKVLAGINIPISLTVPDLRLQRFLTGPSGLQQVAKLRRRS